MFHVINTLDLTGIFKDVIHKILARLNFSPTSVALLGLNCIAQIHDARSTMASLTALVNQNFMAGLKSAVVRGAYNVTSMRMTTVEGDMDEQLSVTLEPLEIDPVGSYHVELNYRSRQNDKFNEFVNNFGERMVLDIVEEVEKHA